MFYRQQIPEGSASSSEPKTVIFDDIQPLNLKSNLYYNPHRESMYNYDVTNSTSIGRISTPSESSFPQSSKSSESFPSESYMSTKLSNYESNITSPRQIKTVCFMRSSQLFWRRFDWFLINIPTQRHFVLLIKVFQIFCESRGLEKEQLRSL